VFGAWFAKVLMQNECGERDPLGGGNGRRRTLVTSDDHYACEGLLLHRCTVRRGTSDRIYRDDDHVGRAITAYVAAHVFTEGNRSRPVHQPCQFGNVSEAVSRLKYEAPYLDILGGSDVAFTVWRAWMPPIIY